MKLNTPGVNLIICIIALILLSTVPELEITAPYQYITGGIGLLLTVYLSMQIYLTIKR